MKLPGCGMVVALVLFASFVPVAQVAAAADTQLEVRLQLADENGRPLGGLPVRVTFGPGDDWAAPGAGQRVAVGTNGEARFEATVELGTEQLASDTTWFNFFDSGEAVRTVEVFVALPFLGQEWLYGVKLFRFADGTGSRRGFDVYLPDESGRYTRKFSEDAGTYTIDLGNGMVMQGSGYSVPDAKLEPVEGAENRWTLTLSFVRQAEPVRR